MVFLTALWLPILLSAVAVFIASTIIHMVLKYHNCEYRKLPNEDKLMDAMRAENLTPGVYMFPRCDSMKEMGAPAHIEKCKKGPVGMLTVLKSGPPEMGKSLTLWFIYSLVMGLFAAYVAGRTLGAGEPYLMVFRVTGTVAFVGYGVSQMVDSIWKGVPCSATLKNMFDGLVYALLTAGVFGWLWPR